MQYTIKFKKDTYHPRKRSLSPEYLAGKTYTMDRELAGYFIGKGFATLLDLTKEQGDTLERIAELETRNRIKQRTLASGNPARGLQDLLRALKIQPAPSEKLTTPAITDKGIEEFKKYFSTKRDITASDLADMILTIYTYSKDIKDNRTLGKVSTDLLTLYRLTKYYDDNKNGKRQRAN